MTIDDDHDSVRMWIDHSPESHGGRIDNSHERRPGVYGRRADSS